MTNTGNILNAPSAASDVQLHMFPDDRVLVLDPTPPHALQDGGHFGPPLVWLGSHFPQ